MNFGMDSMGSTRHRPTLTTPTFIASIMAANGVASNSTTGASGGATSINTTGATLLVAMLVTHTGGSAPSPWTFADSASNTWTFGTTFNVTTDVFCTVAYCNNPTTSATHSFTASFASSFAAVFAFGTSHGWTIDQQSGSGTSQNSPQTTPSITPATAKCPVLAVFGDFNSIVTGTVNNSFAGGQGVGATAFIPQNLSGSPCVGGAAYFIQNAKASINTTFTFTPTGSGFSYGSIIVSFKHST